MPQHIRDVTGLEATGIFGVHGTDLGYLWDSGRGYCLAAFGDSFSGPTPEAGGDWRAPIALRTSTSGAALDEGIVWDSAVGGASARQLFDYARSETPCHGEKACTVIPSDGVLLPDGTHRLAGAAIGDWTGGPGGTWRTNFIGWFESQDADGEHWRPCVDPDTNAPWRLANSGHGAAFQNQSLLLHDDQLYVFGTPSGRQAGRGVYLARVPWRAANRAAAWQWWGFHDGAWSWGDRAPSAIFHALCPWTAIGEINVRAIGDRIAMVYVDGGLCWARTAEAPDAPWTPPKPVASAIEIPALYAPAIHPWSPGLGQLHLQISQWTRDAVSGATGFYGTRQWQVDATPCHASLDEVPGLEEAGPDAAHPLADRDPDVLAKRITELGDSTIDAQTLRQVMPMP